MSAAFLSASSAMAQQNRPSPPGMAGAAVDGNRVTVYYSRPFSKDSKSGEMRKIWGGLVPYGSVWRFGANEAALLVTQQPIEIGGTTVPAGAYSLFMLPTEKEGSKLIINKQIGQHGTQYDEKQDLVRVDMKQEAAEKPVDQFTVTVARNPEGGGVLKVLWEQTQFSVPFTVKK
jgi:hypothetical protein